MAFPNSPVSSNLTRTYLLARWVGTWKPGSWGVAALRSPGAASRGSAPEVFADSGSSPGSCRADTLLSGQESGCLLRGVFVSPKIDTEKQERGFPQKRPSCSSVAGLMSHPMLSPWGGWHGDLISVPSHMLPPVHNTARCPQLAPSLSSKYDEHATSPKPCPTLRTQPWQVICKIYVMMTTSTVAPVSSKDA